ncbi:hypothetical protein [Sphingobacterium psychroaquaticum]|uniref:Lipoprotein n=1 Tax=Sphingobacterium psychroaquaticum TaxID=561061 RepID=A0A1X7LEF8_9SPHI|nr:hypothetical protein [Sphingobacterium psychroaquaticum]SMG52080.1 hypothetical protein SAMN05660862_0043 [Sphingobacterium psychroaquaticum]
MKTRIVIATISIASLISSCHSDKNDHTVSYHAIYKRDTARLTLTRYKDTFYGKLNIHRAGNIIDSGEVQGKITKDTLTGDYYYRPHGTFRKKRRPLALLASGDSLIQGNGTEMEYMGIPYYAEGSIDFDSATFIYLKSKLR